MQMEHNKFVYAYDDTYYESRYLSAHRSIPFKPRRLVSLSIYLSLSPSLYLSLSFSLSLSLKSMSLLLTYIRISSSSHYKSLCQSVGHQYFTGFPVLNSAQVRSATEQKSRSCRRHRGKVQTIL